MSKENTKVEVVETVEEVVEATEVAEVTENKILNGIKKHGKKIAVGAAAVIGGAILFALGKSKGRSESVEIYDFDGDDDLDIIDVESNDVE